MRQQQLQQRELLRGQVQLGFAAPGSLGRRIQLQVSFAENDGPGTVVAARQRMQPGGQFEQAERFDQVVVGARIEPADTVPHAHPGR